MKNKYPRKQWDKKKGNNINGLEEIKRMKEAYHNCLEKELHENPSTANILKARNESAKHAFGKR